MPRLIDVFRSDGAVAWQEYGVNAREGPAELNRTVFEKLLCDQWLPMLPDIMTRLNGDPPARIVDIGCGEGWSSIAMARAFRTRVSMVTTWTRPRSRRLNAI